jgi:hypothetical protein
LPNELDSIKSIRIAILSIYPLNNPGQNTLRQAQGAYPEPVEGYHPLLFEKIPLDLSATVGVDRVWLN